MNEVKSYVVVIKILDRKYSTNIPMYRYYTRIFDNWRQLRDYLVKFNLNDSEYTVYEETNIKIKRLPNFRRVLQ